MTKFERDPRKTRLGLGDQLFLYLAKGHSSYPIRQFTYRNNGIGREEQASTFAPPGRLP